MRHYLTLKVYHIYIQIDYNYWGTFFSNKHGYMGKISNKDIFFNWVSFDIWQIHLWESFFKSPPPPTHFTLPKLIVNQIWQYNYTNVTLIVRIINTIVTLTTYKMELWLLVTGLLVSYNYRFDVRTGGRCLYFVSTVIGKFYKYPVI